MLLRKIIQQRKSRKALTRPASGTAKPPLRFGLSAPAGSVLCVKGNVRLDVENLGFTILGILIGGIVGHRLALGRDKRREFNDVARPVYVDLLEAQRTAENGSANFRIDFRAIEEAKTWLSNRKRVALSKAIGDYRNLMSTGLEHVGGGAYEFKSELYPQLVHVLERLSSLLRPR